MATIDKYKIVLDVEGQQAVDRLRNSLGGLGATIAGIGFGALITSAFKLADAFDDVAAASGLAVGEVAALAEALKEAGGEYEDVGKVVAKFYNSLEEAAGDSSSKAAQALEKLGIGLNELRTLSEGQLLAKALDELSRMEAGAARTALGVEVFSKAFAKIDPAKLQEILQTKDVRALQAEMQRAAETVNNLEASFFELQKAVLRVLTPLIGETNNFRLSAEQADKVVKILGGTLLALFGAKLIAGIVGAVSAILTLNKALAGTAFVANLLGKNPVIKILGGLAVAAGIGAAAWSEYDDEIKKVEKSADDLQGKLGSMGGGPAFAGATGITEKQAQAMQQAALAAKQVTDQLIRQNAAANKLRQIQIDSIGMESDRANLIKSNTQAELDNRNAVADLDAKIVAERAKGKDASAQVIVELEKQKTVVNGQLQETLKLNQAEYQRLQLQKEYGLILTQIEARISRNVQKLAASYELEINSRRALGKITQEQGDREQQINRLRLDYIEKEAKNLEQIEIEQEKGNNADLDKIRNLQSQNDILSQQYYLDKKLLQQKIDGQKLINESQIAGVADAMESISKQFTPYKMAQDAIMMGWQKIGSAVDEFVQTGKFKFSDFAKSVLRDLAAMILKAQIFAGIKAALGFFGLSLPGLAEGGPAKAGQPYIVGEKGPELFVPKSAGTVIPNKDMAADTSKGLATGAVNAPITNNYITNNINALDAKSVAQLFVENRKTLLGSVNMARKEMPYGMA